MKGYPAASILRIAPAIFFTDAPLAFSHRQEATMKKSQDFLRNAENCVRAAESATDAPTRNRFKRMEAAWRALAEEQDWLDGEVSPARKNSDGRKSPPM
jgi:hypothetical protein